MQWSLLKNNIRRQDQSLFFCCKEKRPGGRGYVLVWFWIKCLIKIETSNSVDNIKEIPPIKRI
mgnify:CR=1 FL=1